MQRRARGGSPTPRTHRHSAGRTAPPRSAPRSCIGPACRPPKTAAKAWHATCV